MLEELKKLMMISLGSVSLTRERMDEILKRLVQQGQITRDQGAKVLDALAAKGEKEREAIMEKWKQLIEEVLSKMDIARGSDLESLKKRIARLEKAQKER